MNADVRWTVALVAGFVILAGSEPALAAETALRPPAVPLVVCDPYFSIWSPADRLTDAATVHWTRAPQQLTSLVRVDGKTHRVMGTEPAEVPPLKQTSLEVLPTRTIYQFAGAGIELTLTFMTPVLPDDLDILSRPVTYLTWTARATDGRKHAVQIYYDNTAELVVDQPSQQVVWSADRVGRLAALRLGTEAQMVLATKGDNRRIDWGYLYVAAPRKEVSGRAITGASSRQSFMAKGTAPKTVDADMPRAISGDGPVAAFTFDLGRVGKKSVSRWLMLVYDDLYSIQYFRQNLRPYWRRDGMDAEDLLKVSARQYRKLRKRSAAFDEELMADLRKVGGEKYARLCALAYRQCLAGNKLACDANGQPLLFPKENTSNGCIATVDVIYPMAPQFLLFGPALTKAMLISNLDYANSPRWKWPFAPHDLGTYPKANAQAYGGGERTEENQMPVEESGNMLILLAALAHMEGNADFVAPYWPLLTQWAEYLKDKGFDPENQLCTDDFMGHLAHNVNLSVKATMGIASFAYLAELRGENATAAEYRKLAEEFAARWVEEADDGDHYRLAFDKPGTWSQKYNLVWDTILGFDLYPDAVCEKETAYYRRIMNPYGLPLDNRSDGAKTDWSMWTATLTGDDVDFQAIMAPVYRFVHETPQRVAMGDWYNTANGHHIGMHTRPVVGGLFLKMLYDEAIWKKWAGRDRTKLGRWASLPKPPKITVVVPTSRAEPKSWRYTFEEPVGDWTATDFDTSDWQEGLGGFGTRGTPGATIGTRWRTSDIWICRDFELKLPDSENLYLWLHHDEDAEVYINGVLAAKVGGFTTDYEEVPLSEAGKAALRPGQNRIVVHCHQTVGGQFIDLGFATVEPAGP
ncbi:MAG: DUF4965 domain-containing protein [Phycisphaerales bacterium]|nr:MAG: DUF4965 domain-containing protein [Phycisphaerales bacterium]